MSIIQSVMTQARSFHTLAKSATLTMAFALPAAAPQDAAAATLQGQAYIVDIDDPNNQTGLMLDSVINMDVYEVSTENGPSYTTERSWHYLDSPFSYMHLYNDDRSFDHEFSSNAYIEVFDTFQTIQSGPNTIYFGDEISVSATNDSNTQAYALFFNYTYDYITEDPLMTPDDLSISNLRYADTNSDPAFAGRQITVTADEYSFTALFNTVTAEGFDPLYHGDYNYDGIVNLADYTVWRDNFGGTDGYGDGNLDGLTDGADYLIWQRTFGQEIYDSFNNAANTNVPEPSSIALAALAGGGVLLAARRKAPEPQ